MSLLTRYNMSGLEKSEKMQKAKQDKSHDKSHPIRQQGCNAASKLQKEKVLTKKRRKKGTTKHDESSESESEGLQGKGLVLPNSKAPRQVPLLTNQEPQEKVKQITEDDTKEPKLELSQTDAVSVAAEPGESEQYSTRYSKRKIVSNWDRYKSLSDEEHLQEALASDSFSSDEDEPIQCSRIVTTASNLEELNSKLLSLLVDDPIQKPIPICHLSYLEKVISMDETSRTILAITETGTRCLASAALVQDEIDVDSLLLLSNNESQASLSVQSSNVVKLPPRPILQGNFDVAAANGRVNVQIEADWLEDLLGDM